MSASPSVTQGVVGCALIGCGAFATAYHLPAVLADPRIRLVAICEPTPGPVVIRAARDTGALLTSQIDRALSEKDCDFVVISTPHGLHAEQIRRALTYEKHVLVDKPFVLTTRDARGLAKLAEQNTLITAVAFNRRLDAAYSHARRMVERGELGELRYIETVQLGYPAGGWYADIALGGGGPFIGRATHLADAVPWLLGRVAVRVSARLAETSEGYVDGGGWITVELSDGLVWHCTTLSRGFPMWDQLRIFGDAGVAEIRRPPTESSTWAVRYFWTEGGRESYGPRGALKPAVSDFVDAILEGGPPACSFCDAHASVHIVEAAYHSAKQSGCWIDLPHSAPTKTPDETMVSDKQWGDAAL